MERLLERAWRNFDYANNIISEDWESEAQQEEVCYLLARSIHLALKRWIAQYKLILTETNWPQGLEILQALGKDVPASLVRHAPMIRQWLTRYDNGETFSSRPEDVTAAINVFMEVMKGIERDSEVTSLAP